MANVGGRRSRRLLTCAGTAVKRVVRGCRVRTAGGRTGSQNGHGLGLSIVAAVAAAHSGALALSARPEGGLRVQISLPLAATIDPAAATA